MLNQSLVVHPILPYAQLVSQLIQRAAAAEPIHITCLLLSRVRHNMKQLVRLVASSSWCFLVTAQTKRRRQNLISNSVRALIKKNIYMIFAFTFVCYFWESSRNKMIDHLRDLKILWCDQGDLFLITQSVFHPNKMEQLHSGTSQT